MSEEHRRRKKHSNLALLTGCIWGVYITERSIARRETFSNGTNRHVAFELLHTFPSNMSSIQGLKPLSLLGGYNAAELWPMVNLVMLSWTLIFFAPRWRLTPTLTVIVPVILAVMYTLVLASAFLISDDANDVDMMTFEGVVTLFKDPSGVFAGWLHYCVYDPLVGRWIVLDSVKRGATINFHVLIMIPLLLIAMFVPPTGWLLYMVIVRPFLLLPHEKSEKAKSP